MGIFNLILAPFHLFYNQYYLCPIQFNNQVFKLPFFTIRYITMKYTFTLSTNFYKSSILILINYIYYIMFKFDL